jgi:methionine sulfoxide reductase catalytic subunit
VGKLSQPTRLRYNLGVHPLDRRRFTGSLLAAAAPLPQPSPPATKKILLPSDVPDEFKLRIMWYNPCPPVDQTSYRLKVSGLVDKPLALSLLEMRKFPQERQSSRMKCVQCWSARNNWGGFRFGEILERAKPRKTARAVRVDCADKWFEYFTLDEIRQPRVLLCLDLEGKPLPDQHGAPLRLLDPARYGYKSAKLITAITFVEQGKGSMACDIGPYYSPTGEIQAGYDNPQDIPGKPRRKIKGGEITEY